MSRFFIERYLFHLRRFHFSTFLKCLVCLLIIYLLNFINGVQYYIWSERSFEKEYHLTMTKIDLLKLDEQHPETSLGLRKYFLPNQFLISNEGLCDEQTYLVILVKSAIENRQARQAIRMTWAEKEFLQKHSIKIVFVLGLSKENFMIDRESQEYRDIIQIDKIDHYYHNSYKMIMMLRWISTFCSSQSSSSLNDLQKYVLFIDDDYYLNLHSLLIFLNKINQNIHLTSYQRRTFLTGHVYNDSRPRRFLNDRWYISIADYPYDRYPPYVTAGCFLMTRSNARLFHLASNYIPLFRFDDIYMGILAYSMSIELVANNELFSSYDSSSMLLLNNSMGLISKWKRFFRGEENFNASWKPICAHGYRGDELIKIWNQIYQTNLTLPVIF